MAVSEKAALCDRAARDRVAGLILRFRDGIVSYDALEQQWPHASTDHGLEMLRNAAWGAFKQRGAELSAQQSFTDEEYGLLTRMALFAASDLPYEWPHRPVATLSSGLGWRLVAGISAVLVLLLGRFGWPYPALAIALVIAADRFLHHGHVRRMAEMAMSGDLDVWPFLRRADFETACSRCPEM